ncbi:MAG TPA: DNA polymerase III subunit alpha [Chthonomonadales bacterium]|nr:DNA polymerase III subunit alpha [Chthonomonadales bacterium]
MLWCDGPPSETAALERTDWPMPDPGFVHLHTHSEFSLLDGAARLQDLVTRAAELEMPALALTDHGAMYGAFDFYHKCRAAGIKPIVGVEAYMAPGSRLARSASDGRRSAYHMVLLARNRTGYRNLLKLTTIAAVEGFYGKPRIDREALTQHSEGLVATSACLSGELCVALKAGDYARARDAAAFYRDLFGAENYFIEIQDHSLAEQRVCNEGLLKIARELGLKTICTNDVHYLRRDDAYAHDVLLCIGTGATYGEANRLRYDAEEFYMKTAAEMAAIFPDHPEALEQTLGVAEMCDLRLDYTDPAERAKLPLPEVPEGRTPGEHLRDLALRGLNDRMPGVSDAYRERIEYELSVVEQTGFAQYFLIVRDFAQFARERGIFFGVRGSAAGSLTSFGVGITDIDPVEYGLTFERFLNPERVQMPDIDMDFEDARRAEVIEYVTRRYGEDHVAQIVTFGTLAARAAIKDVGRALAYPIAEVNKLVAMVPNAPHMTLDRAMADSPQLREAVERDERARSLVHAAQRLEGLSRNASVHAAGVVISSEPLTEYTPLQRSQAGGLVSQYPASALEQIGLLKMDFLGLINLSILGRTLENIERARGERIDVGSLPLDDIPTFDLLGRGETAGIFQLESAGMRRNITQLKPTSVRDLAAMVALYRPGPMAHIPTFIRSKHGLDPIRYPHPRLQPILEETYGVIVYQDQVMEIARAIAGYTLGQADVLRRAMGKKKADEMARERSRFVEGAGRNGVSARKATEIFGLIEPFAGYAFNKAHAVCYAMVAYQTAYLKAHYPVEYMAALMTCYMQKPDKMATCKEECRRMGIEVLRPDVNRSDADFAAEGTAIRYGLAGIKNVGRGAVESVLAARGATGDFQSLPDFCDRIAHQSVVNRATIETLIQSGAFDSLHPCRRAMVEALDRALQSANRSQRDLQTGQVSLFGNGSGAGEQGFSGHVAMHAMPDYPLPHRLSQERDLLGMYLSGHPLDKARPVLEHRASAGAADLAEMREGDTATVCGIITRLQSRITKATKEPMASLTLEDLSGHTVEVTVFPAVYREYGRHLAEDAIVVIEGRVVFPERVRDDEVAERHAELRADRVERPRLSPGDDAEISEKRLYIRLRPELRPSLPLLKSALAQYPGDAAVVFHVPYGDGVRAIRARDRVEPSDDLQRTLQRLLGAGASWLS